MGLQKRYIAYSIIGALSAILWYNGIFITLMSWTLVLVFGVIGFILGVSLVLCSGKKHQPKPYQRENEVAHILLTKMMERRSNYRAPERKTVTSRNLDLTVQEIVDLILRDYVLSWYQTLGRDPERFKSLLQQEIWHMFEEFSRRVTSIDRVQFMTRNVVNAMYEHFRNIRLADAKSTTDANLRQKFLLHPWMASEERELEFLRKVAEVFLIYLLPKEYKDCSVARHLLREILACDVFKPAIDLICDPDYINQKLYGWLDFKEQIAIEHKRTYTYAATYEDFMNMIANAEDIEHLKHMRYNIISEIMQATTIQNLKRAKGLDTDRGSSPKGTTKGDLLKARNLKRYINQLTVCKTVCEKRIHLLGGPDYKAYTDASRKEEHATMPGKKVYSFAVVMDNAEAQNYFLKYLHRSDKDSYLRFWTAIESMKQSAKKYWHQQASEIYQMYITHPSSLVRSKLERSVIKGMEAFMIGDTGPEAFYEAQDEIYQMLEEHFYPSFIVSDIYHHFIVSQEEEVDGAVSQEKEVKREKRHSRHSSSDKDEASSRIAAHSTYAQLKLQQLDDRIMNKSQALQALRRQKPDKKILKLQEDIEDEIEVLKTERRQLEFHIDRTDVWIENVGRWKAHIYNAEGVKEEDKMVVYFVIVVHLPGTVLSQPLSAQGQTQGWVVSRRLHDFHILHHQLIQIDPALKKRELPQISKLWFKSVDSAFLDKAKNNLEDYLMCVLQDEQLGQSEPVFAFFSPSPEHLKQTTTLSSSKHKKFSFVNIFKGTSTQTQDSDSDDELLFVDDEGFKEDAVKDSSAKALYLLLGEVFELQGMFKWLRRTLMVFVKVTFGRSINKQLFDTVEWIVSEPMMIYYLQQFRGAYWPDGQLMEAPPGRTDEEKLKTRRLAKEKFLLNMPDAVKNLFGEGNVRRGAIKFFEALQDVRLNKNLFYELLGQFLYELFPELDQYCDKEDPPVDTRPRNPLPIINIPTMI